MKGLWSGGYVLRTELLIAPTCRQSEVTPEVSITLYDKNLDLSTSPRKLKAHQVHKANS